MAITILGISVVILGRESNKITVNYSKKGIIYAILGSLGQAVGLIFSKVGMEGYNVFASTQIRIIAGFISFTLFIIYRKEWDAIKAAFKDKRGLVGITLGSIAGPFLGVSLSLLSLQYTTAGISSTITSIVPVTIIPVSILVFNEKVKLKEVLGAIVTVVGVGILFLF